MIVLIFKTDLVRSFLLKVNLKRIFEDFLGLKLIFEDYFKKNMFFIELTCIFDTLDSIYAQQVRIGTLLKLNLKNVLNKRNLNLIKKLKHYFLA